ncbi:MAG TPA: 2Fe-2S iron-sulfur cluster binding domain-containing protein [Burkholderiales bacterium]|nr:2Fe-2S iron-sulfur cluster binding domain-containing protein [Burkholderiales bacterium]
MQITLEGHDRPVPARAGDTLLAALLRAGLPFPFSCQSGNCGTCKCQLLSGDVEMLEYSAHTLSPGERSLGVVLACRTLLRGDAVVRRID